ncbi:MAG TPA: hypothetical protein VGJ28_01705 [Micromonosporaceae bacterium]|jgi:hypothetical protein
MDRQIAQVLLSAWELPEFRDALQHVIDLDEVTSLLTAFAAGAPDEQTRMRGVELARTATETPEIRNALVLLLRKDDFRAKVATLVAAATPDRPALGKALAGAVADPKVAAELSRLLESPKARASIWKTVDSQLEGKRGRLIAAGFGLVAKKEVRRLLWSLKRHGLLKALRTDRKSKPR